MGFAPAQAQEEVAPKTCAIEDRMCVIGLLESSAQSIENTAWRDQTYRELAKTLAFEKETERAIALIDKIENPDTKAMTIRGIGMAVADNDVGQAQYRAVFQKLHESAKTIEHPPSFAIALTYIAMAQAFAGDNEGAWETAASMENDALRHKAYGETAEIQAEQGNFEAAMTSIFKIGSVSFRNKAYGITAKILADSGLLDEAFKAAMNITNSYKRSQALQYVLDKQKPREVVKR